MKAQITIFIIIGILILAAFGITILAASNLRTQAKQANQPIENAGIQPIQDMITTCLALATDESLLLLGKQGGTLYVSQGGLTPDGSITSTLDYTDERFGKLAVPFLVMPPVGTVGTLFYSEPPEYPFKTFPYIPSDSGDKKTLFTGYYGSSTLAPLYKTNADGQHVSGSLQESLESAITTKTIACANFTSFSQKGYDVSPGSAVVSLVFAQKQEQFAGEQYLTVRLLWPIDITTPSHDKSLVSEFGTRENVRLATLYYAAKKLIDSDSTDISFDPTTLAETGLSATRESVGEDSIITLTDSQSTIANKPYSFLIARKNRRPALWLLDIPSRMVHVTPEGRGTRFAIDGTYLKIDDPCPDDTTSLIFPLNASDPDEDHATFSVTPTETAKDLIGNNVTVTIYAHDPSRHPDSWFDRQTLSFPVALCPVR